MFNKRESQTAGMDRPSSAGGTDPETRAPAASTGVSRGGGAVIGASIQVDGALKGNEDLLIQGTVKGTVELINNSVTVGESGQVMADIHAHTIAVEGQVEGRLVAAERVLIRKTARIKGTIVAPRVTLEDGAKFNGSIEMDPETEALKAAFSPPLKSALERADRASLGSSDGIDPAASVQPVVKGLL